MNSIRSLCPGRQAWKIRARVIRKWEMSPAAEPSKPYALQLVLIDSEGCKIEANIKKYLMRKFQRDIVEGNVYTFTFFVLVDNNGSYRAAEHDYKVMVASLGEKKCAEGIGALNFQGQLDDKPQNGGRPCKMAHLRCAPC
ncbi:uncharacterized protein LOC130715258 [Lotus japonicus]|uniref:uncharacterized protein LOC130715258 n=1 Tax=Lotus japonicus TaxID=34305 RepID=UPI0025903CBB|nr:uncharacterized protein LOC130715258 [Lotus japonicus]